MNLTIYIYIYLFLKRVWSFLFSSVNGYVAVDFSMFFFFVYYIGCMLIAKCRLQSHIYIYVIVIFYYLHKTYIQEMVFCLH